MKTLKYACRFLLRAKSYTIINLLGLALSLACCIILMRYIQRELTVDTNCIDREQVYGVKLEMEGNSYIGTIINRDQDSVLLDPRYINLCTHVIPLEQEYISVDHNRFPARVIVTDSLFFQLFRYPVKQGNLTFRFPNSALLTESYAQKIFGNENPIGKVIRCSNGKDVIIEGILGRPSNKMFLNFDIVLSSALSDSWERMEMTFYSFLPDTDMNELNKIGSKPRYVNSPERGDSRTYKFSFIPVKEIYWDSSLSLEESSMLFSGSYSHLAILAGIGLMLLLTGILNFVNIYLVAMLRRGKEYGVKKVFGAKGKELFLQIWTENTILVLTALLIAWGIVEACTIPVERLFNYQFNYTAFDWQLSLFTLILLPLVTSVYPFVKYNYATPMTSIRSIGSGKHTIRSRMAFLCIQYMLTFLLLVLSIYFNRQLSVMLNTDPGFRTKDVIIARLAYESKDFNSYTEENIKQRQERIQMIDNELSACPSIEEWESSYIDILKGDYYTNFLNDRGEKVRLNMRFATPHFFRLYDIKFVDGSLPDLKDAGFWGVMVANKAALEALHYTSYTEGGLIEETFRRRDASATASPIVAVVNDYYGGHLTLGKKPTIYMVSDQMSGDVYQIACAPGKKKEVLDFLRKMEMKVYGSEDFEYSLLEENVKAIYDQDRQIAAIYSIFACIAIVIACLGLFGISLFDIRQRYREIAIRKVNGAQLKDLYLLLFRKYIVALGIAYLLAVPSAYYIIYEYTKNFVVKAPIGVEIFLIAFVAVTFISLGTLSWQVYKAAQINPSETIKTE